jgi:hypothetical protein
LRKLAGEADGGIQSGALDLDPRTEDARERPVRGGRRAAAELAGETQSWVFGLGSMRGRHLGEARELVKLAGAVAAAAQSHGAAARLD